MEQESNGDTKYNRCTRYSHQRIFTGNGCLGNKRTSEDHLKYNIVETGLNTKKNLDDLRRFAVTHTPVKNYQLMLP